MRLYLVPYIGALALGVLFASQGQATGEQVLWVKDRITPDQPFPAKICAVSNLWPGYNLLLEEIGGNRLCVARIWLTQFPTYSILDPAAGQTRANPGAFESGRGWIYLSPSVEIEGFSWSMGVFQIGRRFEDDVLAQTLQNLARSQTELSFRVSRSLLTPWVSAFRIRK